MPDNPFAALTDRERQNLRAICREAGCLECEQLLVIRGRNCNSYGCKVRGCEQLTKAVALFKLVAEGLTRG